LVCARAVSRRMSNDVLVLLCFVDESFKADFYGFGGLLADGMETKALTAKLNDIMSRAWQDFGIPHGTELHAHPMFHGKDAWADVPTRVRINIFEQVIDAVTESSVTMLLRAVRPKKLEERQISKGYPDRHPPEQVCFLHILQRVHAVAEQQETQALIIADERDDRERHRERFSMYQAYGTPGLYMQSSLDTIVDTVHFAPSHHSRMLQAVDLVTFTWTRWNTVTERDPRQHAVMARLISKIYGCGKLYKPGEWP